ncbi:hypothetical protein V1514DRAFT_330201 [Lipomyces japonicus]|uniref:uncharacterized protein n=1 Tax=Lipomyces japonicus TaxID=56871 RepID=UPI0034CDB008
MVLNNNTDQSCRLSGFQKLPIEIHTRIFKYVTAGFFGSSPYQRRTSLSLLCKEWRYFILQNDYRELSVSIRSGRLNAKHCYDIIKADPDFSHYIDRIYLKFGNEPELWQSQLIYFFLMIKIIVQTKKKSLFIRLIKPQDDGFEFGTYDSEKLEIIGFNEILHEVGQIPGQKTITWDGCFFNSSVVSPMSLIGLTRLFPDLEHLDWHLTFNKLLGWQLYSRIVKSIQILPRTLTRLSINIGYTNGLIWRKVHEVDYFQGGIGDRLCRALRILSYNLVAFRYSGPISVELFTSTYADAIKYFDNVVGNKEYDVPFAEFLKPETEPIYWPNMVDYEVEFAYRDSFGQEVVRNVSDFSYNNGRTGNHVPLTEWNKLYIAASEAMLQMPKIERFELRMPEPSSMSIWLKKFHYFLRFRRQTVSERARDPKHREYCLRFVFHIQPCSAILKLWKQRWGSNLLVSHKKLSIGFFNPVHESRVWDNNGERKFEIV